MIRKSLNNNSFFGILFRVLEELKMRRENSKFLKNAIKNEELSENTEKTENTTEKIDHFESYLNLEEFDLLEGRWKEF